MIIKTSLRALACGVILAGSALMATPSLAAGAIAVDTEEGQRAGEEGYGLGWGDSRDEAGRAAMRKCRGAGNDSCKVVARFDTCGAYGSNRTTYGVGWGRTEAAARAMALENCPTCRIVLAECE
jgi:hypothetical protein